MDEPRDRNDISPLGPEPHPRSTTTQKSSSGSLVCSGQPLVWIPILEARELPGTLPGGEFGHHSAELLRPKHPKTCPAPDGMRGAGVIRRLPTACQTCLWASSMWRLAA